MAGAHSRTTAGTNRCASRLRYTLLAASILVLAQTPAHGADDKAAPVIDNKRVTVFDLTLSPGKPWQAPAHINFVVMFLVGAKIQTNSSEGKSSTASRRSGQVVYVAQDTVATLQAASSGSARIVILELKGPAVLPLPNDSGYPLAFPRPGAKKVFENDRVIAWNSTWKPGVPTAMHYHDKDVVVVFRNSGSIKSTPLHGESTVADIEFGTIRFSKSDRTHSEELVKGRESAIVLELK